MTGITGNTLGYSRDINTFIIIDVPHYCLVMFRWVTPLWDFAGNSPCKHTYVGRIEKVDGDFFSLTILERNRTNSGLLKVHLWMPMNYYERFFPEKMMIKEARMKSGRNKNKKNESV